MRFNPRARGGRDTRDPQKALKTPVSIHAPVGGATLPLAFSISSAEVSIHAPVGGATLIERYSPAKNYCFNPRARGGRDTKELLRSLGLDEFQSTRPWGARQAIASVARLSVSFQSTRPWGARRRRRQGNNKRPCVSIHAPVGGATPSVMPLRTLPSSFNPRARGGRDSCLF